MIPFQHSHIEVCVFHYHPLRLKNAGDAAFPKRLKSHWHWVLTWAQSSRRGASFWLLLWNVAEHVCPHPTSPPLLGFSRTKRLLYCFPKPLTLILCLLIPMLLVFTYLQAMSVTAASPKAIIKTPSIVRHIPRCYNGKKQTKKKRERERHFALHRWKWYAEKEKL